MSSENSCLDSPLTSSPVAYSPFSTDASSPHHLFDSLQTFPYEMAKRGNSTLAANWSLGVRSVSRLPVIMRKSCLKRLRMWGQADVSIKTTCGRLSRTGNPIPGAAEAEIPFVVARHRAQTHGRPLLVDLAAWRSTVGRLAKTPELSIPRSVDLVLAHSVQVDLF